MLGDTFFANQLRPAAREIYDHMLREFRAGHYQADYRWDASGGFSTVCGDDGKNAMHALFRDHPEYDMLSDQFSFSFCGKKRNIRLRMLYSQNEIARIQGLLFRELTELTKPARVSDLWERERIIYTCVAAKYQYEEHDKEPERSKGRGKSGDYNVVGLLARRSGVCSAYSSILILALRSAGIPCHCVSGGGHRWVMAYLNDIPVHCDVTWESHNLGDRIAYSYFNLTDAQIKRDHIIETSCLPTCAFSGYSYFHHNQSDFTLLKLLSVFSEMLCCVGKT